MAPMAEVAANVRRAGSSAPPILAAVHGQTWAVMQSPAGMPVGTWMSTALAAGAAGSEATDLGGSFSIVRANAPAARANATANIFNLCMVFPFVPSWLPFHHRPGRAEGLEQAVA